MLKTSFFTYLMAGAAIFILTGLSSCKKNTPDVPSAVPVEDISVEPGNLEMLMSEVYRLKVTVYPEDAAYGTIGFSSDTPSVAEVDGEGNVTAVSAGNAVITVTCEGLSAACSVTVLETSLNLAQDTLEVVSDAGTYTVGYAVTNPLSGIEPEGKPAAEWITGVEFDGNGMMSFSVAANTVYSIRESSIEVVYGDSSDTLVVIQQAKKVGDKSPEEAEVGDFYMSDGTLVDSDAELTEDQKNSCLGIVYSTDRSRLSEGTAAALEASGADGFHGFVMALVNVDQGEPWGAWNVDVNEDGQEGEPYYENTDSVAKMYNNIYGYEETMWMIGQIDAGLLSGSLYGAFNVVRSFDTMEDGRWRAPEKTTGWFLPSIGQWWEVLENLADKKEDLEGHRADKARYLSLPSPHGNEALEALNARFSKATDRDLFGKGQAYWTTSETNEEQARRIEFYAGGNLYLGNEEKDMMRRIRLVLVF